MAKTALIERELKRAKLVAKYAKKHAEFKAISTDAKKSEEERAAARLALQKLPRNANPTRQRNRCEITGRPRGTFRQFLKDLNILKDPRSGKVRTLYSLRHTYATFALSLAKGTDIHLLARQMGTSVLMIERHYSHLIARMRASDLVSMR